jgi:hypothetical protein
MDSTAFLAKVAELLDHDGVIEKGQSLEDLDLWDSLGILSIDELIALAGDAVSE